MSFTKKHLFLLAAVLYVLLGAVAIFFASEKISRYQYHTLGAEAQNIALLAAQFLELSDADYERLKKMDFSDLRNSDINKKFAERFSGGMHDSLKYVYVISRLRPDEIKYHVDKNDAGFYRLDADTPLDAVWLLDVIVNKDERTKAEHVADYYDDKHRYTALHGAIRSAYEASRATYMRWTDEWGAHVSGLVPLYTKEGAYIGMVGADFYQNEFSSHKWNIIFIMVLLFLLPGILLTTVYYTAYRRYDRLMWRYGNIDELTGVYTRRFFMERMRRLLESARKRPRHISLIVLDIDDFKPYNDTYGHQAGDEALRRVARTLAEHVRTDDFVARMGGEEFVIVLPDADGDALREACERLKRAVEALGIEHVRSSTGPCLTVSQGGCHRNAGGCPDLKELLEVADKALYMIKKSGKNAWLVVDAAHPAEGTAKNGEKGASGHDDAGCADDPMAPSAVGRTGESSPTEVVGDTNKTFPTGSAAQ